MSVTVEWLTMQSDVKGIHYLAGEKGGQHIISGINIMDNPDTVPWLKQDEMVLSTGYLFSSTDLYKTIIRDLHAKGCSGLGIKMNRYINQLPEEMLTQANELDFPIINIPFSSTMEQIVNIVYHEIVKQEMSSTQLLAAAYRNIATAAMKKHSLLEMLRNISTIVKCPVFLTSEHFDLLEYFIPETSSLQFPFPFSHDANTLFSENDIVRLEELHINNPLPVREFQQANNSDILNFQIFSIVNKKNLLGYLVCAEENKKFVAQDFDFISNIGSVLYIAIMNHNLYNEGQRSNTDRFYNLILSGSIKDTTELESMCLLNNFDFKPHRICAAFHVANYDRMTMAKRRAFERNFWNICHKILEAENIKYIHTVYNTDFLVFLLFSEYTNQSKADAEAHAIIQKLHDELLHEDIQSTVGFGRCCKGAESISLGYFQAMHALKMGPQLHPDADIFSYQQDYVVQRLYDAFSTAELREMYDEFIYPLERYDLNNNAELCRTLETYLECQQNTSATAKKLFIHRNTMIYRISQIELLLGIDIKDSDSLYRIQTGFYIRKLLKS